MAREIIDTRGRRGKRAARAAAAARRGHNIPISSPPMAQPAPPKHDVSVMLTTTLEGWEYRRLQNAFDEQDHSLADCATQLRRCRARVDSLEKARTFRSHPDTPGLQADLDCCRKQLADLKLRYQSQLTTISELRAGKTQAEDRIEGFGQVMEAGAIALRDKNQETEDLHEKVRVLENRLAQNDETISGLNATLLGLTMAAPEQWMQIAMEFQATRNLAHVQGLTRDIAERDSQLKEAHDRIRRASSERIHRGREMLEKRMEELQRRKQAT